MGSENGPEMGQFFTSRFRENVSTRITIRVCENGSEMDREYRPEMIWVSTLRFHESRISIRVCENRPDMVWENTPEMIRVSNLIFHMPDTI